MEAAATPLPREETTPPVMNMYFGPVRKALEFLRENRRTPHYYQNGRSCQTEFWGGKNSANSKYATHVDDRHCKWKNVSAAIRCGSQETA